MKTHIVYLRDLVTDGDKADKVPPQVKAIMKTIAGLKVPDGDKLRPIQFGDRVERPKVVEALAAGGELVTRQTPDRILSFYQPRMTELGLINVVKEAEEKPAKEPKPGKASAPGEKKADAAAKGPAPAAGATA